MLFDLICCLWLTAVVILTSVFLCKPTVGQFTITFAHSYTSTCNWKLCLLEPSGEKTILHEKYAGCDLLSTCILSR